MPRSGSYRILLIGAVIAMSLADAGMLHLARASVIREQFLAPGEHYRLLLIHDAFLGQTETLTVTADPDSRREREVFRSLGDQPVRFVRWRGPDEAELDVAVAGGGPGQPMLLRCGGEHCSMTEP